jgi:outer membrane lipoprotein-sorting protein
MKMAKLCLALAVVTGLVFAQAASTGAEKPAKAAKSAAASLKLSGTLASVDAIGNTIVVKTAKADETLSVEPTTKITNAGKKATLADLAADGKVVVKYKKDGDKMIALSISETAAKAAAAEKPAKASKKAAAAAEPAAAPAAAPASEPAATPEAK